MGSPDECSACAQVGAIPTTPHLLDCQKLYGNLCSCGADHKVDYPTNEKECDHWWRELMRNDKAEWLFYCQKCLEIKHKGL